MSKKILAVNANHMGDALFSTPALAALRRAYPDARIDSIAGAGVAADVLRGNPDIDHIIPRVARGGRARVVELFRLLRRERYSDVVFLAPLPAYGLAAWLARTPNRTGPAGQGLDLFLTRRQKVTAVHLADRALETVPVPPEMRPAERRLRVTVERQAVEEADHLLEEAGLSATGPIVAFNMGATKRHNRWFPEHFAAALDLIHDLPCVLIGAGAEDAALAVEVLGRTERADVVNLVGRTQVKPLAALLARCGVIVTADTGPMHLATAVGTPAVALFGGADPAATGPYDDASRVLSKSLPCAPCGKHPTCEGRHDCMRQIMPDEVALAVRDLLRQSRGHILTLPQASAEKGAVVR